MREMSTRLMGMLASACDIYSRTLISRFVVLGMMLLGALCMLFLPTTGRALGALPFLVLVVVNRERFTGRLEQLLHRRPALMIGIPLFVLASGLILLAPVSGDDLLKHIVVSSWPGGYRQMYPHSAIPAVELYLGFDWIVGRLASGVGTAATMWIVQALALTAFCWVFAVACLRRLAGNPLGPLITLLALTFALVLVTNRLLLGRPEIFFTIWALAAVTIERRASVVLWVIVGALMSTGYWLAPIYFPAAVLLSLSRNERVAAFLALLGLWNAWWAWISEGGYLVSFGQVLLRTVERVEGMQVGENASVFNLVGHASFVVAMCGAFWAARQRGADRRTGLVAAYFALSNQVRYVSLIAPLLMLQWIEALREVKYNGRLPIRVSAVVICSIVLSGIANSQAKYADLPRFRLPAGAKVFTGFTTATYSTVFANPGQIQMVPGFDIGALDSRLQKTVVELNAGRADCETLAGFGFTHVVESSLKGETPPCLRMVAVHGGWRLWEVR